MTENASAMRVRTAMTTSSTDLNWIANYIWGIADDVQHAAGAAGAVVEHVRAGPDVVGDGQEDETVVVEAGMPDGAVVVLHRGGAEVDVRAR